MYTLHQTANSTELEFDRTIARHLHVSTHAHITAEQPVSPDALSKMLHTVLVRYVALLESDDHSGWSEEEDRLVRAGVQLLAQTEHQMPMPAGQKF